ncbi:MAG: hypothetical protein ACOCPQ_03140 [Desulfosudaceae bacterium]
MRLSSEKKIIFAWHDITFIYGLVVVVMSGVALFALSGLRVALTTAVYRDHAWVPALLLLMSVLLGVASLTRLLWRLWVYARGKYNRRGGGGLPL